MTLVNFFRNLDSYEDWGGLSNVGIFNVETGMVSARSEWIKTCDCTIGDFGSLQYLCKVCGKTLLNNLTIQSGDGDGMYSVVSLMNSKAEPFGALIHFDYDSKHAKNFMSAIGREEAREFDGLAEILKSDLLGTNVGKIKLSRDRQVLISDAQGGVDSEYAVISLDNWTAKDLTAVAFYELSDESPHVQMAVKIGSNIDEFTGGLEDSIRPRVLLLIASSHDFLLKDVIDNEFTKVRWQEQISAWSKQQCIGHISPQGEAAMYWNARLENNFVGYAMDHDLGTEDFYLLRQFSWLLHGREIGSDACAEEVGVMIENSEGELAKRKVMRQALEMRGLFTAARAI